MAEKELYIYAKTEINSMLGRQLTSVYRIWKKNGSDLGISIGSELGLEGDVK